MGFFLEYKLKILFIMIFVNKSFIKIIFNKF